MKIIALEAENLKRLTAVRIEPDGNLVQITGKNGHGKTSVLDAIWWALDGKEHVQAKPIRKGEEQATIRLDLGDLKVTRKFRAQEDGSYTTSITVENGDGARFRSPQKMLDDLMGELTFDPLEFTRMKPAEQVMSLRKLVSDFDFEKTSQEIQEAFRDRTEENRKARELTAAAKVLADGLPPEIPDMISDEEREKIADAYEQAMANNAEYEAKYAARENYERRVSEMMKERKRLEESLIQMRAELAKIGDIPSLEESQEEISKARAELFSIDEKNRIAAKAAERTEKQKAAEAAKKAAEELSTRMEALKTAARVAIAKADLPVKGLTIEEGAVHMDGVPFDQASDAQQLQASIGIAMALNPKLRVVRVRDGSLLDEDAIKVLAQMADDRDYQIWIERVDSSGQVGFVLQDGHLKDDRPQEEIKEEPKQGGLFADQAK